MSSAPSTVSLDFRVRYAETDQMGVVYHANYLVWCEMARTELIRKRGPTYAELEKEGVLLAVADANIRYQQPARYDDVIRASTWISAVRSRTVTFDYNIYRVEPDGTEVRLATASTKLIALDSNSRPRVIPEAVATVLTNG